jgi:flavin reductase (DIM6/NTAB) family NADH-FMN oxidoreductase RutF
VPKTLSERLRCWIEQTLMGTHQLPGWVTVGHPDPDSYLRVTLEWPGQRLDISRRNRIVELRPLILAIGFENEREFDPSTSGPTRAVLREPGPSGKVTGWVDLRFTRTIHAGGGWFGLFETGQCHNACIHPVRREAVYFFEWLKMALDRNLRNLSMTPRDLFAMWVLHNVPRPVVTVSYGSPERGNIFPMDLLGTLTGDCFVLGLHDTSPAIPLFEKDPKVAICTMPFATRPHVYRLGKNHNAEYVDLRKAPLATVPSSCFGIPVPADALSVREVVIEQKELTGTHFLLMARNASFEIRGEGEILCNVHRIYQQYLLNAGRPLPMVL